MSQIDKSRIIKGLRILASLATINVILGSLAAPGQTQNSTSTYFLVSKGRIFSQTSSAAPALLSSGAAVFEAQAPGLNGTITSATLTLPGGATQKLTYVSPEDLFVFTNTAASTTALDTLYPAGIYKLSADLSVGGFSMIFATNITLPSDNFPPAPRVDNFTAAQAVDNSQDFTLVFEPFAGALASATATLEIYNTANGALILSQSLDLTDTNYIISANTLAASTTYDARLRFDNIQPVGTTFPIPAPDFFSETRFSLTTISGSANQTPPVLTNAFPTNGTVMPAAVSPVIFQFNKPMDQSKIAILWAATLNGAVLPLPSTNFTYTWSDPGTLLCLYAPLASGWPAGTQVSWTLSPTPGNPSNFADSNGDLLATNTYSGNFLTFGGPWNCAAQAANPLEAPAFFLVKAANYDQTSANNPLADAAAGGQLLASFDGPTGPLVPIVAVAVPTLGSSSPSTRILTGSQSTDLNRRGFTDSFATTAALDASYPSGNYTLELATPNPTNTQSSFIVTNSASLTLTSGEYPPIPHFDNFSAAQSFAVSNSLTLTWDPYATANPNTSFISLQILDAASNIVFSAPNSCAGLALSSSSTSVTIPANTLAASQTYMVVLSFGQLVTAPESMPAIPGGGYSATESVTRMRLRVNAQGNVAPPPAVSITSPVPGTILPTGTIAFQVVATDSAAALSDLQLFNGTNLLATLATPAGQSNFTGTISGAFTPGAATVSVVATDANGNSTASAALPILVEDPNFIVKLLSPTNSAVYPPYSTVQFSVSVTSPHGTVTNVGFFMDGTDLGFLTNAPFVISVPQVPPGVHQFYAQAADTSGNFGASAVASITVSAPPLNHTVPFIMPNGFFAAGFTGVARSNYVFEIATNLAPPVNWTPVQTKLLSGPQTVFSDAGFGRFHSAFYRVVPLPVSLTNPPAFSVWDQPDPGTSGTDIYNWEDGAQPSITNTDGTVYTLTIPAGAMGLPQPVSLTLVTNLQDYPLSGSIVAAVDIAPSEFYLFVEGTLTIQLPPGVSATQLVAFTYHQPNGEFFLTPFQSTNLVTGSVTNPAVAIPVSRLGGYGLAMLNPADLTLVAQFPPSAPADALDQVTALALTPAGGASVQSLDQVRRLGPGLDGSSRGARPLNTQSLLQQYLNQFVDVIYPQMQAAAAGGGWTCQQWSSWLSWRRNLFSVGLEDSATLQVGQFQVALIAIVQTTVNNTIQNANSQHDWSDLVWLSNFDASGMLISPFLPAPSWPAGQQQALQQALDSCLTFELDMDSSIDNDSDVGTETSRLKATITFSVGNPSLRGQIKGQAPPVWAETTFPSVSMCSEATASPSTPNFQVMGFTPSGSSGAASRDDLCSKSFNVSGLAVPVWPNFPMENFTMVCQGGEVNIPNFWWPEFGVLHVSELTTYPASPAKAMAPPRACFNLTSGWQIQGGGNPVLATYTANNQAAYQSGTVTETTTMTLKHTPQ